MPTPPLDQQLVAAYADAFAEHPFLKQNGFAFLIDISGKLFKPKGSVSLKDIEGNIEALYCTGFRQMHLSSIHTHTLVKQPAWLISPYGVLPGCGVCHGGEPWCRAVFGPPPGRSDSAVLCGPEAVPPWNHCGNGLCGWLVQENGQRFAAIGVLAFFALMCI